MTITIPTWLLWTFGILIGVPAILAICALACFGFVVAAALSKGVWK